MDNNSTRERMSFCLLALLVPVKLVNSNRQQSLWKWLSVSPKSFSCLEPFWNLYWVFKLQELNHIYFFYIFGSRKTFKRWPFTLNVLPVSSWIVMAPWDIASITLNGPCHLLLCFPWPKSFTLELNNITLSPSMNSLCFILLSCHLLVLSLYILELW